MTVFLASILSLKLLNYRKLYNMQLFFGLIFIGIMCFFSVIDHMPGFLIFGALGGLMIADVLSGGKTGVFGNDDEHIAAGDRRWKEMLAAKDRRFQELCDEYDERQAAKIKS